MSKTREKAAAKAAKKQETAQAVATTPAPAPAVPTRPSSGSRIRQMVREGLGTEAILVVIHREYPELKTTAKDVSWNRWKMRKDGENVPRATVEKPAEVTTPPTPITTKVDKKASGKKAAKATVKKAAEPAAS